MPDRVDDRGLVVPGIAKARLKWTHQLHQQFVDSVSQLGGVDKATPKSVMRVMGIPGITLYHLKSHLQKYRLSRRRDHKAHGRKEDTMAPDNRQAENANQSILIVDENTNTSPFQFDSSKSMLQLQLEVQRRLQEQIEVQKHLQLRIEAQGKYLQSVLRKAQETIVGYNLNSLETEHAPNPTDCSTDSCLTSSDLHVSDCSENCSYNKEVERQIGDDESKGEKKRMRSMVQKKMEDIEIDLNR